MKVSEKSLELNVGAELLGTLRNGMGFTKAYLRGLTQREEKQEGVDFFLKFGPQARFYAFQFKAPKGNSDGGAYRYTIQREQHQALYDLAQLASNAVFYVFPHYVTTTKLQQDVPNLLNDTWILSIDPMMPSSIFGSTQSKIVRCEGGRAFINPEYGMHTFQDIALKEAIIRGGVPAREMQQWHAKFSSSFVSTRRSPWLTRGLRVAVVLPSSP